MGRKLSLMVTGAPGCVGYLLSSRADREGWHVRGTLLAGEHPSALFPGVEPVLIHPLGPDTPWAHAVKDVDTVIHLAARVHVMRETSSDPLRDFRMTNSDGTARLAQQAAAAGVKRFVFLSTIGV